jgi:hypothetical protein
MKTGCTWLVVVLSVLSGLYGDPTSFDPMTETVHYQSTAFNSPHLPSSGLKTDLSFLYMKAYEDGLEYADQTSGSFGATIVGNSKVLHPPFKWAPGCRALIGYQFGECDTWDISLSWTYFHTHLHESHSSTDLAEADFPPLWDSIFLGSSSSFASVNWMLNLNMMNLILGKDFFLSRSFAVHPFVGLLTTWINQDYKTKYQGIFYFIDAMGNQSDLSGPTSFGAKNKNWGIGPQIGTDLFFHFSSNWGLFGKLSGALLWSEFDVAEVAVGGRLLTDGAGNVILIPARINHENSFHTARFFADTSLGFFYEQMLNCNRSRIALQAGYECSFFLSQNEFFDTLLTSDSIDIGSGFTANNSFLNHIDRQGTLTLVGFVFKVLFDY